MTFLRQGEVRSSSAGNAGCRRVFYSIVLGLLMVQVLVAQQTSQESISALIRQNRLQEAEQQLWGVLGGHQDAGWALDLLGRIRLRQSRFDEAEALFRKVLETNPKDIQAYRGLGETYRFEGKDDGAIETYSRLVKLAPADADANLALAKLYLRAEQYQESLSAISRVPSGGRTAEFLPLLAADYFGLQQNQKVPPLIDQVLRQSLKHPAAAIEFAAVLARNGYVDDAAHLLKVVRPAKPSVEYLRVLARVLDAQGAHAEARRTVAEALKLDPNSADLLFDSAHLAADAGDWERAAGLLTRANAVQPDNPETLTKLTVALLKLGRVEGAVETAKTLVSLRPKNLDAQYLLALAFVQNDRWEAAEPIARTLIEARPMDANSQLLLARIEFDKGDRVAAKQTLARCLAIDPNMRDAHFYIAQIADRDGDLDTARTELERLVQAVPTSAAWQEELGGVYLKTGDLQKARVALEAAARLAPDISVGHYQLGVVYARLGLQDRAHEEMEQYQRLRVVEDNLRKGQPAASEPATAAPHAN